MSITTEPMSSTTDPATVVVLLDTPGKTERRIAEAVVSVFTTQTGIILTRTAAVLSDATQVLDVQAIIADIAAMEMRKTVYALNIAIDADLRSRPYGKDYRRSKYSPKRGKK